VTVTFFFWQSSYFLSTNTRIFIISLAGCFSCWLIFLKTRGMILNLWVSLKKGLVWILFRIIIIITLFMSQVYLAEHRGSTNWGDRKSNQHKSNQIKCWFLVGGENRSTQGKTSWSWVENQQTQPTYDVRSGSRTQVTLVEGQCSHHCANTAPKEGIW